MFGQFAIKKFEWESCKKNPSHFMKYDKEYDTYKKAWFSPKAKFEKKHNSDVGKHCPRSSLWQKKIGELFSTKTPHCVQQWIFYIWEMRKIYEKIRHFFPRQNGGTLPFKILGNLSKEFIMQFFGVILVFYNCALLFDHEHVLLKWSQERLNCCCCCSRCSFYFTFVKFARFQHVCIHTCRWKRLEKTENLYKVP